MGDVPKLLKVPDKDENVQYSTGAPLPPLYTLSSLSLSLHIHQPMVTTTNIMIILKRQPHLEGTQKMKIEQNKNIKNNTLLKRLT